MNTMNTIIAKAGVDDERIGHCSHILRGKQVFIYRVYGVNTSQNHIAHLPTGKYIRQGVMPIGV